MLISPQFMQFFEEQAKSHGPIISGALFGAGWWFWADACTSAAQTVPFVQYLPGITATIALIMINCIRREELETYDAFDEGVFCRSRSWLFISYVVSFASVIAAVWVLLQGYALGDVPSVWPGAAGVLQVIFILAAALVFFVARTPAEGGGGYDYGSF
jgi:hypothetical protein